METDKKSVGCDGFFDVSNLLLAGATISLMIVIGLCANILHSNYVGQPISFYSAKRFEKMASEYPGLRPEISRWLMEHKNPSPMEAYEELQKLKKEGAELTIKKLTTVVKS